MLRRDTPHICPSCQKPTRYKNAGGLCWNCYCCAGHTALRATCASCECSSQSVYGWSQRDNGNWDCPECMAKSTEPQHIPTSSTQIICGRCSARSGPYPFPTRNADQRAREDGWVIDLQGGQHRCPKCAAKGKDSAPTENAPPPHPCPHCSQPTHYDQVNGLCWPCSNQVCRSPVAAPPQPPPPEAPVVVCWDCAKPIPPTSVVDDNGHHLCPSCAARVCRHSVMCDRCPAVAPFFEVPRTLGNAPALKHFEGLGWKLNQDAYPSTMKKNYCPRCVQELAAEARAKDLATRHLREQGPGIQVLTLVAPPRGMVLVPDDPAGDDVAEDTHETWRIK